MPPENRLEKVEEVNDAPAAAPVGAEGAGRWVDAEVDFGMVPVWLGSVEDMLNSVDVGDSSFFFLGFFYLSC